MLRVILDRIGFCRMLIEESLLVFASLRLNQGKSSEQKRAWNESFGSLFALQVCFDADKVEKTVNLFSL
jgi:hypothetical protein